MESLHPTIKDKPISVDIRMKDIIHRGEFTDHPEVEEWLVGIKNPLDDLGLLRKSVLAAKQPDNPLTDCCDVEFPNNQPLHFHAGLGDNQKKCLFEVMETGVEAKHSGEMTSDAQNIFNRATAVATVLLKGELNPTILQQFSDVQEGELADAIHGLAHENVEFYKKYTEKPSHGVEAFKVPQTHLTEQKIFPEQVHKKEEAHVHVHEHTPTKHIVHKDKKNIFSHIVDSFKGIINTVKNVGKWVLHKFWK